MKEAGEDEDGGLRAATPSPLTASQPWMVARGWPVPVGSAILSPWPFAVPWVST